MKKVICGLAFAALSLSSTTLFAGQKMIKLSVPNMSCVSCPIIVSRAVSEVSGVIQVTATMEDRTATVTFDDVKTSIDQIREATANIGYPSSLIVEPTGS